MDNILNQPAYLNECSKIHMVIQDPIIYIINNNFEAIINS